MAKNYLGFCWFFSLCEVLMMPYLARYLCRFKEERSPKPKKKFGTNFGSNLGSTLRKSAIGSIRRPNMANFRQKIKSKLRRGNGYQKGLVGGGVRGKYMGELDGRKLGEEGKLYWECCWEEGKIIETVSIAFLKCMAWATIGNVFMSPANWWSSSYQP